MTFHVILIGRRRTRPAIRRLRRRTGMVLIWCALLMTVLLGMVGLIIDAGMCMASQRQAQNAADAGALAAAMDKLRGKTDAEATSTAVVFVQEYNQDHAPQVTLDPDVNFPPTTGAYEDASGYVEVIVRVQVHTFLIRLLPGASSMQEVSARAVAGIETVAVTQGVAVLNAAARPGLDVSGNGRLFVNGKVTVNSEGGGLTETGAPINNGNSGVAASVSGNGRVTATEVSIVGGVNDPTKFQNYVAGGPSPLHTGQLPTPDPLSYLPTPTVANGVDPAHWGTPQASNGNLKLNDPSGLNEVVTDQATGVKTMVLYPGVYNSISITGGNVRFYPGIFVLSPLQSGSTVLTINGGNITAKGIMFYNTGSNYNPNTGAPDVNDLNSSPPISDGALLGGVSITANAAMTPIDTANTSYDYGGYAPGSPVPSSDFNGLVFYQRRNSTQQLQMSGNGSQSQITGLAYARSGLANFTGQGAFNAQFIFGSIRIAGQGNVTINNLGGATGTTKLVFLVE